MNIDDCKRLSVYTKKRVMAALRYPHSVILLGPSGRNRHDCAGILADTYLGMERQASPDYHELFVTKDTKRDDIDLLREKVSVRAVTSEQRVICIDNASGLDDIYQNALLKDIEDLPAVFILIAEEPMLETVSSRCEVIDFTQGEEKSGSLFDAIKAGTGLSDELIESDEIYAEQIRNAANAFPERAGFIEALGLKTEKDKSSFYERFSDDRKKFEAVFSIVVYLAEKCREKGIFDAEKVGTVAERTAKAKRLYRKNLFTQANFCEWILNVTERRVTHDLSEGQTEKV